MSSVGSSDSSNSSGSSGSAQRTDEIRKTREAASAKESELVKKHQREIRRLNEEHYGELEKLKKDYELQMNDLRKSVGTDVNERDHKYHKDIEDLRGLYQKQLQTQAHESQRRDESLRQANTGDLDQEKTQAKKRFEKLNEDYEKGLLEREAIYRDALIENRKDQSDSIADVHDKLQRNFDEEAKSLKEERNLRVGGLQKGYDDYRQSSEARFRDQDLRHFQDQQRSSHNLLRAVAKERLAAQDNQEFLRDGFKEGLDKTRERFEKAMSDDREAGNIGREQTRSTVGDRIANQVTRLKEENTDLKDEASRKLVKDQVKLKREVSDIQDSYRKNMENYREQRDEAVRGANDRVHKDVEQVRGELDKQATETNRFYRTQQDEQNRIHRSAYDNLKGDFEIREEATKNMADKRVKQLYEVTAEDKSRMADLQVQNHTATQRARQDDMKAVRVAMEADKQIAVNNLQEHIQRQEIAHSEQLSGVVAKYEKQVQTLKDQIAREHKAHDETIKRSVEEMERQHKLSMDQVATQNKERMRQLDAQHSEELRTLNKRNDEKMDQLVAEVKKT